MSDWQPIATAPQPTEDKPIIVGAKGWCAVSSYRESSGRWFTSYPAIKGRRPHDHGGAAQPPTHWIPAPEPPR